MKLYARENLRIFFLVPILALGVDDECGWFIELGWLSFVVGLCASEV